MVGNTGTLMTMRLVRSKLRKREESSTTPATTTQVEIEAQQTHCTPKTHRNTVDISQQPHHQQVFTTATVTNCNSNIGNHADQDQVITFTRTSGVGIAASNGNSCSWVFPPKAPTPNIYNCMNNDALLAASDKNGFKGFRKQFSGRFKRLVAKKPEPAPAIPPELKPQLKTIYVY